MLLVILAFFGLCAGSFINALVWRLHQQNKKLSILKGRSVCPNCRHELAAKDLVPILSWLYLKGGCRYCGKPISRQYPLVELATAAVFVSSYLWWPVNFSVAGQKLLFASWLISSVGLMALLVYDFKWMLLPNRLIYPTLAVAVSGRLIYLVSYSPNVGRGFFDWFLAVAVASGFFWLLYIYSKGKWIGFGDVRLGLITGTLLAKPSLALGMIFVASLLGTLFTVPSLVAGKKGMASRIPFGPFLITATYIMVLFGDHLVADYQKLLS